MHLALVAAEINIASVIESNTLNHLASNPSWRVATSLLSLNLLEMVGGT